MFGLQGGNSIQPQEYNKDQKAVNEFRNYKVIKTTAFPWTIIELENII